MHRSKLLTLFMAICLVACQDQPARPTATRSPTRQATTSTAAPLPTATLPSATEEATPTAAALDLAGFPAPRDFFTPDMPLKTYQPQPYTRSEDALPINLAALGNPQVLQNLTPQQKSFLSQNGFVVIHAGDLQFKDLKRSVADHDGQPYYLTTDAAYHALHITFDDMLAYTERSSLRPTLYQLLKAQYVQVEGYLSAKTAPALQTDLELSQKYLAVALKLLYPDQPLEAAVDNAIAPQLAQIMAYGGKADSLLIPGFTDDYGAYRPVGHYAGKPALEAYFRAMTWLGRVAFQFKNPDDPKLAPSRAPLILTLALREAKADNIPAVQVWSDLNGIIDFLVGPSDDPGPRELDLLMQQVYGKSYTLTSLADDAHWQTFLSQVDKLPAPQINSTFASFSASQAASRDWRLMGQRFTLDSFIFQSLVFDKVGTQDKPRKLPMGLDVAAAFGSQSAYETLKTSGETGYAHYDDQLAAVQKLVTGQPEAQWLDRFYSAWLYAFLPQVAAHDTTTPPYMRTSAWSYKDINSVLGSWTELKHDTVLYFKMPEGLGGGGPPMSGPAPAYVEPNPAVFYRLAYAAGALNSGLQRFQSTFQWVDNSDGEDSDGDLGYTLANLVDDFGKFGDIAARELRGETLTADDYGVIEVCLEQKECRDQGIYAQNPPVMDPIPVVAAVAGSGDSVLEAGVGNLDRIYVAVPLEGKLEIAQGGVFSYYEFTQPRSERLTDPAWRDRLSHNPPAAPAWTAQFLLPGGKAADVLAFRVNDVYILTEKGVTPPLNVRAGPSKSAAVVCKLDQLNYLTLVDGPTKNEQGTWWKVNLAFAPPSCPSPQGWVLENQEWYVRSTNH